MLAILLLFAGWLSYAPSPAHAAGTGYYIDSVNGSDTNTGTSMDRPWKSLENVQNRRFLPGDTINFKRGSSWVGELLIRDSGTQENPITFRDYGTGARPTFSSPDSERVIFITSSWVVVQGFLVKDTHEAGIFIENGANHNVIRDVEITNTGLGVSIGGQYNLVANNYAHDLHMVRNTPGGDDDYGAAGFLILNSNNEVSYNRCINCRAPSHDYGHDGGVVEIYANGDNAYIHHNYGKASEGFLEVGGATARNVRVAYNISDNNYVDFTCLHMGGPFSSTIDNLRIENNTIINLPPDALQVIACVATPVSPSQLVLRNNIIYSNVPVFDQSTLTHVNNIYYMQNDAPVGFPLGNGERVGNPQFVSVNRGDYRLQSSSPAINAGLNLGYALDFSNQAVPQGGLPDVGAHEFAGASLGEPSSRLFLPFLTH